MAAALTTGNSAGVISVHALLLASGPAPTSTGAAVPLIAWVKSVVSAKRTSILPVSAAMVGSAPSIFPSERMVSIRSRLLA